MGGWIGLHLALRRPERVQALVGQIEAFHRDRTRREKLAIHEAHEALANGAVDFTLEVYTWEGVKAELEGRRQCAFRYADYGVPDQHTNFIGSSQAYLDANPETASAFITCHAEWLEQPM